MNPHRTYPRISGKNPLRRAPLCCICGEPATWRLEVQVSWFRGDDEHRDVCDEHKASTVGQVMTVKAPA